MTREDEGRGRGWRWSCGVEDGCVDGATEGSRSSEDAQRRLDLCGSHGYVCGMCETRDGLADGQRARELHFQLLFGLGGVDCGEGQAQLLAQRRLASAHRTGKCASCHREREQEPTNSLILAIHPSIRTTPSHSSTSSLTLAASPAHISRTSHLFSHTSRVRAHRPSPWP
jgi:hypothetical protein